MIKIVIGMTAQVRKKTSVKEKDVILIMIVLI